MCKLADDIVMLHNVVMPDVTLGAIIPCYDTQGQYPIPLPGLEPLFWAYPITVAGRIESVEL